MLNTARVTSHEKTEIVRLAYEAFNRRDFDALWPMLHPDFEVDLSNSMGFDRSRYSGRDGLREFFGTYWESFESISIEVEKCIEGDQGIVAIIRARGRGYGSGVEVDARGPHLWSFRSGLAIRMALHEHIEDALQAAGVPD